MISRGALRDRVSFYRVNETTDDYGNASSGHEATAFCTRWCQYRPQSGRERLEAGRLEGSLRGFIRLDKDSLTVTVTAADKAVINGVDHQVRTPPITSEADRMVEFEVERGVVV